jgi:protein TonB
MTTAHCSEHPSDPISVPVTKPRLYRTSSKHWLKRHRLILITMIFSLATHGLLLITDSSEKPLTRPQVINAQLVTAKPQGTNDRDQDPSLRQSQTAQPQTAQQQGIVRDSVPTEPGPKEQKAVPATAPSTAQNIISSHRSDTQQVTAKKTNSTDTKPTVAVETKQPPENPQTAALAERVKPTEKTDHKDAAKPPANSSDNSQRQQQQQQQQQQKQQLKKQGNAEQFSDPVERNYVQQLLTHLDQRIIAPQSFSGKVRLSLTIKFGQIVTQVEVLTSSGNPQIDSWVTKAAIAANPYPQTPPQLKQPYIFRPTIDLGGK